MTTWNTELSGLSPFVAKASIPFGKSKNIVLDLLLANRSLESSGPSERSRVRPAECPCIRIFIDMRSLYVFSLRYWFEETSRSLNGETWLFFQDRVGVGTIVRAARCGLLGTITDDGDRLCRHESSRIVSVRTSRGHSSSTGSYISVMLTWRTRPIRVDLVWNWVRRSITKFIVFVIAGVGGKGLTTKLLSILLNIPCIRGIRKVTAFQLTSRFSAWTNGSNLILVKCSNSTKSLTFSVVGRTSSSPVKMIFDHFLVVHPEARLSYYKCITHGLSLVSEGFDPR